MSAAVIEAHQEDATSLSLRSLDHTAEHFGQRFDFAAQQNEREDRKHARENRSDGDDAPDGGTTPRSPAVSRLSTARRVHTGQEAPC
jgi:hypothetical protein